MDTKPKQVTRWWTASAPSVPWRSPGGLLAPYFASRVSEAVENLAEQALVLPVQHVPGPLNPADIPTIDRTTPDIQHPEDEGL